MLSSRGICQPDDEQNNAYEQKTQEEAARKNPPILCLVSWIIRPVARFLFREIQLLVAHRSPPRLAICYHAG